MECFGDVGEESAALAIKGADAASEYEVSSIWMHHGDSDDGLCPRVLYFQRLQNVPHTHLSIVYFLEVCQGNSGEEGCYALIYRGLNVSFGLCI